MYSENEPFLPNFASQIHVFYLRILWIVKKKICNTGEIKTKGELDP